VGQVVFLADPASGWTGEIEAGTVGWLFPGPAGVLFAPDLVNGKTTIINLNVRAVSDRMDGITMPHFGPQLPDRYVVVADDVLVVSYPNRALMGRVEAEIKYPWQVLMISDSVLLVLERGPDGKGKPVLTAVDTVNRQVVYRRPLPDGVHRIALSRELGLLALINDSVSSVLLVEPATLSSVASLQTGGPANDAMFLDSHGGLAAVVGTEDGGGELMVWKLKSKKGELVVKKEQTLPLAALPKRIAVSPGEDRVAVAYDGPTIDVVDLEEMQIVHTIELPGTPRDMVWCDPSTPGPLLPHWSSDKPPELRMDP